jgi:hypothetical protein
VIGTKADAWHVAWARKSLLVSSSPTD